MKKINPKSFLYQFGLAAIFGWFASFLQQLVLTGRWHNREVVLGEWIYATSLFLHSMAGYSATTSETATHNPERIFAV
jgi:hypothetical protein